MIYYIVNPVAGSGKPAAALPIIESVTRASGQAYTILRTEKPEDTERIGGLIDWTRARAVVCVGGDGTVQEYTRLAVDRKKPFGLIPVGSANDLLYSLPGPREEGLSYAEAASFTETMSSAEAVSRAETTSSAEAASSAETASRVDPPFSGRASVYMESARSEQASPVEASPNMSNAPAARLIRERGALPKFHSFEDKITYYTQKIIAGRTTLIDAVRVNEGRCFLNIGGTGMDIQVLKDAIPLKKRFGGGAYFLSLVKNATSYEAREMTLTIDGLAQTEKYCLLAFCNGAYYGGHMRIAPPALIDDGLLTVCIITRVPTLKLVAIFPLVKPGWHDHFKEVSFVNGSVVKLEFEGTRTINFDGNLWDYESPVEFRLLKKAIMFIV